MNEKKLTKKVLPGLLAVIMLMATSQINAQWLIYNADVHPFDTEGAVAPLLDISEHSETSPAETLIDISIGDPAVVGNKIFKYFHLDGSGKTMYRHNFAAEAVGTHMSGGVPNSGMNYGSGLATAHWSLRKQVLK